MFAPRFWAGVNLGTTIPGHDPGELAIPRSDYVRWLAEMGELGVRLLRVYTPQRPAFCEALASYQRRPPHAPLWLLQGTYLDEARLDSVQHAYDPILTAETDRDVRDVVAEVHGNASIPFRRGLAYGRYRTSVSRWLLGVVRRGVGPDDGAAGRPRNATERRKASWPILVRAFHRAAW